MFTLSGFAGAQPRLRRHRSRSRVSPTGSRARFARTGGEDVLAAGTRPAPRADRALSGCAARPGADGLDVSARDRRGGALGRRRIRALKDKALEDALQKQDWDPSVKSLAVFPQVLTMMSEKLDWTQKLGDAFLAQQKDVMATVQALREKAWPQGTLKEQRTAEGRYREDRVDDGHHDRACESRGRLRADLQPDRRVRGMAVSGLSAVLLLPAGLLSRGGALLGFTAGVIVGGALWGSIELGRRRRRHQRQSLQQLQPHQHLEQKLAAQRGAPRRGSVQGQGGLAAVQPRPVAGCAGARCVPGRTDAGQQSVQRASLAKMRGKRRGRGAGSSSSSRGSGGQSFNLGDYSGYSGTATIGVRHRVACADARLQQPRHVEHEQRAFQLLAERGRGGGAAAGGGGRGGGGRR